MESKLRKLRQSSSNLEEENALLSLHVDSMKNAVLKVQSEVRHVRGEKSKVKTIFIHSCHSTGCIKATIDANVSLCGGLSHDFICRNRLESHSCNRVATMSHQRFHVFLRFTIQRWSSRDVSTHE